MKLKNIPNTYFYSNNENFDFPFFPKVDNGEGPILAKYEPDDDNFCDGEWRKITAIKSLYVITIQVNGVASEPAIGSATSPSTDTSRPLFFGGHPYMQRVSFFY